MKTLFDVKPGDLLIVTTARGRRIVEVEHKTKTQIETKYGTTKGGTTRWNKKTGLKVGSSYDRWYNERIKVPAEGELEEIRLNARCRSVLNSLENSLKEIQRKARFSNELLGELLQANARLRKFLKDGQDGGDG